MPKITPHLWYDKEAKAAAELYLSAFPQSKMIYSTQIHDTPSGSVDIVSIELFDQQFTLISAGPYFKLNPSISFLVACQSKAEVDRFWQKLSAKGTPLMELGSYPFSEHYGWIQDKYGLSWQIMYMGSFEMKQKITPTLMFTQQQCGKAKAAIDFYASVFHHAGVGNIHTYGEGDGPDQPGTVKHATFTLENQEFAAMDSAYEHNFAFNEAISFLVNCDTQEEIDYYWDKLTAVPEAEQCGWLKDKYGLSWQIVPSDMDRMMASSDPEQVARVTQAFLKMKKFDLKKLREAYEGDRS